MNWTSAAFSVARMIFKEIIGAEREGGSGEEKKRRVETRYNERIKRQPEHRMLESESGAINDPAVIKLIVEVIVVVLNEIIGKTWLNVIDRHEEN